MSGATNTSRVHSKWGGWDIYNNRRSNTSKEWGFPKKGAPLSHTSYWISRPFGLDSAVTAFRAVTLGAAWNVGMACNVFKLLELLWPHPPDVQACTSMYAVNSCSPYTVYGIGQGRIYRSHPLSTPWFAPNLNNPGRRPTVYHIHINKANRIGRRPTELGEGQQYREKANSIGRKPTVYREKANSI